MAPGAPVAPVDPVDPVAPVMPAGPAGPGTGVTTTAGGVTTVGAAAGVTTVGLSHALSASVTSAAEKTIEYFIKKSFCVVERNRLANESQRLS